MLNLTQHLATTDQFADGVLNLPEKDRQKLSIALTFDEMPDQADIDARAIEIVGIAQAHLAQKVMIGGALWLMTSLIQHLKEKNIEPYFSFSKRVVVEETLTDGTTQKIAIFRHIGFISAH